MLAARWGCPQTAGMTRPPIILASASPRRRELLGQLGYRFEVRPADVDERWDPAEDPAEHALRLARAKAAAVTAAQDQLVLGADTVVHLDGESLGKPDDRDAGLAMLARLSGREHEVITAVALSLGGRQGGEALSRSRVRFRSVPPAERERYWATGEPAGKAGGYAIQGLAASFVEHLAGSYSGVVGLPLCETATLLTAVGHPPPALVAS